MKIDETNVEGKVNTGLCAKTKGAVKSELREFPREHGGIQRVQSIRWEDWSDLDFMSLKPDEGALECFYDIYQNYHVPAASWIFDQMVLFQLPEEAGEAQSEFCSKTEVKARGSSQDGDSLLQVTRETEEYGTVRDRLTAAGIVLQKGVRIRGGKPIFKTSEAEKLWKFLEERDCIRIARGKLPTTKIIPVGKCPGYLSKNEPEARLKVNANFFIMDKFDCATVFDHIGTPLGLCVKEGVIKNPPLFHREALLVKKDGSVEVSAVDVRDLDIEIGGKCYRHGENATVYSRPERAKTSKDNSLKLVIVGCQVVAVKHGGDVVIPASGYVLSVPKENGCYSLEIQPGDTVTYHGMEAVSFGIQVGNSIIRNGVKTKEFISRFYNIYHLERVPFPPSLYPMNFEKTKAARIALGADKEGKPVLFWAEGAGKVNYTPGSDSTGASLSEMADIAEALGLYNAVNLDGGGSAQILLEGTRMLRISDRNKADNSDAERLIPLGLVVR